MVANPLRLRHSAAKYNVCTYSVRTRYCNFQEQGLSLSSLQQRSIDYVRHDTSHSDAAVARPAVCLLLLFGRRWGCASFAAIPPATRAISHTHKVQPGGQSRRGALTLVLTVDPALALGRVPASVLAIPTSRRKASRFACIVLCTA